MQGLDVQQVTVRFGGVAAVRGASLTAQPGRVTGLIGPNGAGKTTLFNVISGLIKPVRGRVAFNGEDITRHGVHERARRGIARTFQRLEAFGSLSVFDNVLVAAEIQRRRRNHRRAPAEIAGELLDLVGLASYADRRADTVPTGVARLVELARALATDPSLLLLDEPSSGLSVAETKSLGGLLRELADQGRAVVLVEHDMDLVMGVCDHIHVLDFGRIIGGGSPAEVRGNRRVQEAYLGRPAEGSANDSADGGDDDDGGRWGE